MATDPVCRMTIEESDAVETVEYQGTTYYFCSKGCAVDFREDPGSYL